MVPLLLAVPASEITGLDKPRLEAVEDLSESLANDLLAMSVSIRRRDMDQIAAHLGPGIAVESFPSEPGPLTREVKWVSTHPWGPAPNNAGLDKAGFLKALESFLQHFSEIEDARLKVKQATFPDPAVAEGEARVAFYVVGRDAEGRREWARGTAFIKARRHEGDRWHITGWRTAALASDVAEVDIFSEIAGPAGIARIIPAFGVPPNEGTVSHGGATGDVDGDGLLDLLVTEIDGNRLFLNDGKGSFRDASEESNIRFSPKSTSALLLDVDNDGDLDLFLASVGRQALLENRLKPTGKLSFEDVSEAAGVAVPAVGYSAAAADINQDGRPDIYVASYNNYGTVMPNSWSRATNGTPNLLFINKGAGRFEEASHAWGVDDSRWSYAAVFADVDEDGRQDLFVANDFGEDALFMNKGERFTDEAAARGVQDPSNGMGAAFGDYDNDGDLDLHVTNMSSTAGNRILDRLMPGSRPEGNILKKLAVGNALYENIGGGQFRDASEKAGYFSAGWAYGGGFVDFDNDGLEDEFSVNGFISGSTMNDT